MKRILTILASALLSFCAYAQGIVPAGEMYLRQLQERDSVLVADQLEYGMVLKDVEAGTAIQLPDVSKIFNDTLSLVRGWAVDTLYTRKQLRARLKGETVSPVDIRTSIVIAPWEEGVYQLPDMPVLKAVGQGSVDTLLYKAMELDVRTMPVDTATFEIHDIKGQIRYPLTMAEVIPYIIGVNLTAILAILIVCLVIMHRRRESAETFREPAYITALRSLDRYRGDKFWAPDKQKSMYSGITDTLRTYIESRFGVNAEEMTTAEIFQSLKTCQDITPDLFEETKALFELSDFVKFAKHTASDEDNAGAIPTAVRFVTMTYQTQLDQEAEEAAKEE